VPRRGSGRVDADASTWQATREVRPVPRELKGLTEVRLTAIVGWVVLGAFVLTLPLWLSSSQMSLATIIVIFGIVAASLVVLTGWGGQVSLGQMAFVGVGAAVGGKLTDMGWDLGLAMLAAGLVGGLAAVIVGYPALRRRGLTLAVSTLAFALMVHEYVLSPTVGNWHPENRIENPTLLGAIPIRSEHAVFNLSVATLVLALAMVTGLRRSRTGRVLIAIRENERAAQSYGVNVIRTQLAAFALSGFLAAVAGALYVQQAHDLDPGPYAPERSLQLFCMVVIGGLGSVSGALLGTIYVQGADFFLPAEWKFLASGVGLLAMLMIFPSGLGGLVAMGRDSWLRWVARRRGIVVPSLMGERRADDEPDEPEAEGEAAPAEAVADPDPPSPQPEERPAIASGVVEP
jgi:branched-chain amino acid transport system permease protein